MNCSYKLGELRKDLGFTKLNDTQPNDFICGLFDFRQSPTVQSELAMVSQTSSGKQELWRRTTGAWSNLTLPSAITRGWSSNSDGYAMSAASFLGYAIVAGADIAAGTFLQPVSLKDTTVGVDNVRGMPCAKYVARYRDRLYAANCFINDYILTTGTTRYAGINDGSTTLASNDIHTSDTTGIVLGMTAVGIGIQSGSKVIIIVPNVKVVVNKPATANGSSLSIGFYDNRITSIPDTSLLYPGQPISSSFFAGGTTIVSVDGIDQITASDFATSAHTGASVAFGTNQDYTLPYRTCFSSVPTAGAVTWTAATDFLDVDYSEEITGIGTAFDQLYLFTAYNAYAYDQSSWKQVNWPGCSNHRSIQSSEAYLMYANQDGLWLSSGGRPTCVSSGFTQLIRNSNPTKWDSAVVNRVYTIFLGNTSANGITYTNCLLNYDLSNGMVWWREMRSSANSSTVLNNVRRSGTEYLHYGDSAGNIAVKSRYVDASPSYSEIDGSPIYSQFRTKAFDLGDATVKEAISELIFYSERGSGLKMSFRMMDDNQRELTDWIEIGCLDRVIKKVPKNLQAYFIEFKGEDWSTSPYFTFYGLSALLTQSTKHD